MRPWPKSAGLAGSISLALITLAGCQSDPAPVSAEAFDFDDLVDDLAAAACDWQERCCSPVDLEQAGAFTSSEECVAHAKLELRKAGASLRFAMAEGFIVLNDKAAKACVVQQKAQDCDPARTTGAPGQGLGLARWLQACLPAFEGQIRAGGRCTDPAECIVGTHCATITPVSATSNMDGGVARAAATDTICLADLKRGEVCQVDDDCDHAKNDYCKRPERRCAGRVPEDGKCGYVMATDDLGVPRTLPSPACEAGQFCDSQTNLCRRLPHDGDECTAFGEITCDPDPALDLSCVGTGFSGVGTCKTAGTTGDACGGDGLPPCKGGLTCNPGDRGLGVCGPPPKEGDPCSLDAACKSPSRCLGTTNRCTMPGGKATGQPCAADTDCASLSCSGGSNATCVVSQIIPVSCSGAGVNAGASGGFGPGVDGGPGGFEGGVPSFDGGAADGPASDVPPPPSDGGAGG